MKIFFYLTCLWAFFGLSYTLYVVQVDQGLFAQIAVSVLFLIGQLLLGSILVFMTFKHRDEISQQFRIVTLIVSIVPIILALILVPLLRQ